MCRSARKARLRVGFDRQTRDGYLNNVGIVGPKHLGNVDRISGRASLVVDITPNLENYTIVTLTNSDGTTTEPALYAANPANALPPVLASLAKIKAANDFYATINNFRYPGDFLPVLAGHQRHNLACQRSLDTEDIASYPSSNRTRSTTPLAPTYCSIGRTPRRLSQC